MTKIFRRGIIKIILPFTPALHKRISIWLEYETQKMLDAFLFLIQKHSRKLTLNSKRLNVLVINVNINVFIEERENLY